MALCKQCNREYDAFDGMVMLHDPLWESIADDKRDCLCDVCIESRLGRQINESDFKESIAGAGHHIPCNELYMMNHPNKFKRDEYTN